MSTQVVEPRAHSDEIGPSPVVTDRIWLIIVIAFTAVLIASFAVLGITLFVNAGQSQILLTVFTTAAGFLAGLLSPSPVVGRRAETEKSH